MKSIDNYILESIKKYKSLSQIGRELGYSRQYISIRVKELRKNGFIIKVGGGQFRFADGKDECQVGNTPLIITKQKKSRLDKSCRPHNFRFTIDIPEKFLDKWIKNRKAIFEKYVKGKRVKANSWNTGHWVGFGFLFKGQRIHFNNKSITCMWLEDDFINTDTAMEGKRFALFRFFDLVDSLEVVIGFTLRNKGELLFRCNAEHFAKMKSPVAYHFEDRSEKLQVRSNVTGKVWSLVDISIKGKPEFEMVEGGEASFDYEGFEDVMNDLRDNRFKPISEQIKDAKLEMLNFTKELLGMKVDKKPDDSIKQLSDYDGDMFT